MNMRAIAALLLCLYGAAVQARADTAPAKEPSALDAAASVDVKGMRDPDWKPYSAMLKGVKRYEEKHALAPGAQLRFILEPRMPMSTCTPSRCGWKATRRVCQYRWGSAISSACPSNRGPLYEKAELTVNRKAGSVRWLPYVRSAATSDTIRRLGDLRLTCEVHWAIDKETLPFAMRTAMGALGGPCNFVSQKGTYSFAEARRIMAATISYDGKSAPVPFSGFVVHAAVAGAGLER